MTGQDGEAILKAARSRIGAMKIAPCAGLASSRAAAEEMERALDYLTARLAPATLREAWRHRQRGSIVDVMGRGRAQCSVMTIREMDPVVIYRHNDEWWVRHANEFADGRFEPISPATRWTS